MAIVHQFHGISTAFSFTNEILLQSTCSHPVERERCECTKQKPHVHVQRHPPIVVDRPSRTVVVEAQKPIHVRTSPVIYNRPGEVEFRPSVVKYQPKPHVVNKKFVRISRPLVKKFYVEQYSKTEPCPCKDRHAEVRDEKHYEHEEREREHSYGYDN